MSKTVFPQAVDQSGYEGEVKNDRLILGRLGVSIFVPVLSFLQDLLGCPILPFLFFLLRSA
jgi:hypothetical protein